MVLYCFEIKIRTNTTKWTNVRITRFRQCRDLVRESEMFIKDKAQIASRVSDREVLCILLSVLTGRVANKSSSADEIPERDVTYHLIWLLIYH